jgi:prolyl-tRNA synthetase
MGSYGIGTGRLMASIAEAHHDEHGLIWPITVAPFSVSLLALGETKPGSGDNPADTSDRIYQTLQNAGIEVLYDDREESPGVKFNDADLIGCPIRLTVSRKTIQSGGIEVKRRDAAERSLVAESELASHVKDLINQMHKKIQSKVVEVPFVE